MNVKCVACGSCGFPMEKAEDFALNNIQSPYCRYCADDSGKLLPYEKILEATAQFYMESQGIEETSAKKLAKNLLSSMPAWQQHH